MHLRSFTVFALISGLGWLADFGLLFALVSAGIPAGSANFLSAATAACAVYIFSRRVAFRRPPSRFERWGILYYVAYTGLVIVFFSTAIGILTPMVGQIAVQRHWWTLDGLDALITKVMVTPPNLILNFIVSRYLAKLF